MRSRINVARALNRAGATEVQFDSSGEVTLVRFGGVPGIRSRVKRGTQVRQAAYDSTFPERKIPLAFLVDESALPDLTDEPGDA